MFDKHVACLSETTPYLVLDTKKILDTLRSFQKVFGSENVYYAVKANPEPRLIGFLNDHQGNFEVSSVGELESLLDLNVPTDHLISAVPVKTPYFVQAGFQAGVQYFVADSVTEVETIAASAPGSKLTVRLTVSNEGSAWPLSRKFGVPPDEAVQLLEQAKQKGLLPWGLCFHVGSQCTRPETWVDAVQTARVAWELAAEKGILLKSLNLGGGFPVTYGGPVPAIEKIGGKVIESIKQAVPGVQEVIVEPGRAIVGAAGILVTSVIARANRSGQEWLYLDVGVFNGLMESIGGIRYPYAVERGGETSRKVLAGPSCDSFDVIDDEVQLPDIEIGERILVLSAGAYTTAYASEFGGAPIPEVHLI
jgi:ornithine decarboxylase